uniref:Uncharacterized protein n=1 Tax=Nelumbo nucifera TaxID=4432 RepID=A0A822XKH8_NELNU|nr:TPA_asm: hypothetical protein HUJ06_021975 [Nelumbo nucifera]
MQVRHSEQGSDEGSEDRSGGRKRRCINTSCDLLAVVSGNSPAPMQQDPAELHS